MFTLLYSPPSFSSAAAVFVLSSPTALPSLSTNPTTDFLCCPPMGALSPLSTILTDVAFVWPSANDIIK